MRSAPATLPAARVAATSVDQSGGAVLAELGRLAADGRRPPRHLASSDPQHRTSAAEYMSESGSRPIASHAARTRVALLDELFEGSRRPG